MCSFVLFVIACAQAHSPFVITYSRETYGMIASALLSAASFSFVCHLTTLHVRLCVDTLFVLPTPRSTHAGLITVKIRSVRSAVPGVLVRD